MAVSIVSNEMLSTCQYIRAIGEAARGGLCARDRLWEAQSGQIKQIPFTGQVSDAAITAVSCNHIQSTKEVTINGVYSFYFLLCMILYIWLFFFP